MKALKIIGWIIIPYVLILFFWRKMGKNTRILSAIWAVVAIAILIGNSNSDDKNKINEQSDASVSASIQSEKEIKKASLGDTLSTFDKVYGKGIEDTSFFRYKDDYILILPLDNKAYNITVQFESTEKKRRTKEEALKIAEDFIPLDAIKVKGWQAEVGLDVIQYESKILSREFERSVFEDENPAGTFIVMFGSDDSGIFSIVMAPGNNP